GRILDVVEPGGREVGAAEDVQIAVVGHAGVADAWGGERSRGRPAHHRAVAAGEVERTDGGDLDVVHRRPAVGAAAGDVQVAVVRDVGVIVASRRERGGGDPRSQGSVGRDARDLHVVQEAAADHVQITVVDDAGVTCARGGERGGRGPRAHRAV